MKTNRKNVLLALLGVVTLGVLLPGLAINRRYQADLKAARQRITSGAKIAETACGRVEYLDHGTGAPVLVIHGTGGGYDQGDLLAQKIGGLYRYIVVSRFGYLGTPLPDDAGTAQQAEAHACLLDALGVQEAVTVVAISGGGPSALQFALRYPGRTRALVMISAVSHPAPPSPAWFSTVIRAFRSDLFYWWLSTYHQKTMLALLGLPNTDQANLAPEQVQALNEVLEEMLPFSPRGEGLVFDLTKLAVGEPAPVAEIQAPTLVVHARNDTLVPFSHAQFSATIPGAELFALERGGHFASIIDERVKIRVAAFLAEYNR